MTKEVRRLDAIIPPQDKEMNAYSNTYTWVFHVLAFLFPCLIVFMAFFLRGLAPFGDQSLLSMDLWGEYFPMYHEQYAMREAGHFAGFSWNGALGFNAFAQFAYYANSPLHWFYLLFRPENLILAVNLLVMLKFGLLSLTAFVYFHQWQKLRGSQPSKLSNSFQLACASMYAFSAYQLAFLNQPMWIDVAILFPLILLGLEHIFHEKGCLLYIGSLALAMIANFYISFSVCIFLVLYTVYLLVLRWPELSISTKKAVIRSFIISSVVAAGLSAFVLVPTYKAILLTDASQVGFPGKIELYHSISAFLGALLPSADLSWEYGTPNLYAGTVLFFFIPLYFLAPGHAIRKRVVGLGLLLALYLSLNLNLLDYVWHGFHFPNQLPGRWSFIVSFVLLSWLNERSWFAEAINRVSIFISAILSLGLFLLATVYWFREHPEQTPLPIHLGSLLVLLVCIFLVVLSVRINHQVVKKGMSIAMIALLLVESGWYALHAIHVNVPTSKVSTYQSRDAAVNKMKLTIRMATDEFSRMELVPRFTFDTGQLYGYPGINFYSSTMNGHVFHFLKNMGYGVYANNISTLYNEFYPLANAILSVRYLMDPGKKYLPMETDIMSDTEAGRIHENRYVCPLLFPVEEELYAFSSNGKTPFEVQETIANAMSGTSRSFFSKLEVVDRSTENVELKENENWLEQYYFRIDKEKPVRFVFRYRVDSAKPTYLYHDFRAGKMTVQMGNGKEIVCATGQKVHLLPDANPGDELVVKVDVENINTGIWGMDLYQYDASQTAPWYESVQSGFPTSVSVDGSKISANMAAADTTLVMTTIPDDGGWSVHINGQKRKTLRIDETLLAFFVPAGENRIDIRYQLPGLRMGIGISLVSVLLAIGFHYIETKRLKRRNNK